ncbi:MAG: Spy/CpxP family protein refolding chaperone [Candidatus Aminicenantes bacterium]|jgi:hypothetical protein
MRKNILVIALGIIFIMSISQVVLAQRYYRDNPYRYRDYDYYDLKLTETQRIKIEELELNLEKEISPLLSELRVKDLELQQLYNRANPDEQKIETKINEIIKIENAIAEKESSYYEKVRNLLTEEQKGIIDSYYRDFGYDRDFYGRRAGRFGQAFYGRGFYRQDIGGGYGRIYGRGYYGRGQGRLGWSDLRGYGRGYYGNIRWGRGPCGRGLGRFIWRDYGYRRGWWK